MQSAFQLIDSNKDGKVSIEKFREALIAMKIEFGEVYLKNIIKMFDEDGDSYISLIEFEKQMSKYLDQKEEITS